MPQTPACQIGTRTQFSNDQQNAVGTSGVKLWFRRVPSSSLGGSNQPDFPASAATPPRSIAPCSMSADGPRDQQGAALPWAAVELQQAVPPEADVPAKLGLSLGSRIEASHAKGGRGTAAASAVAAAAAHSNSAACPLRLQVQWTIHLEQDGGQEASLTKVGTLKSHGRDAQAACRVLCCRPCCAGAGARSLTARCSAAAAHPLCSGGAPRWTARWKERQTARGGRSICSSARRRATQRWPGPAPCPACAPLFAHCMPLSLNVCRAPTSAQPLSYCLWLAGTTLMASTALKSMRCAT